MKFTYKLTEELLFVFLLQFAEDLPEEPYGFVISVVIPLVFRILEQNGGE